MNDEIFYNINSILWNEIIKNIAKKNIKYKKYKNQKYYKKYKNLIPIHKIFFRFLTFLKMSVFRFFKKDMEFVFFLKGCEHNGLIFKYFFQKNEQIFFWHFSKMDNKKGKKGKLFFIKYFLIINDKI